MNFDILKAAGYQEFPPYLNGPAAERAFSKFITDENGKQLYEIVAVYSTDKSPFPFPNRQKPVFPFHFKVQYWMEDGFTFVIQVRAQDTLEVIEASFRRAFEKLGADAFENKR